MGHCPRGRRSFLWKNNESYPPGTGQFSVRIKPDNEQGVRGVIFSNDRADAMVNWLPKPSFAIDYKPAALYLYYKYLPFGGDSLVMQIYFYKLGEIIANSYYVTSDSISEWTATNPAWLRNRSASRFGDHIFCNRGYVRHSESMLYIDNLSFTGFVNELKAPGVNQGKFCFSTILHGYNCAGTQSGEFNLEYLFFSGALVKSETIKPRKIKLTLR